MTATFPNDIECLTEKTVQVGIPGRLILPPLVPVPRAACEDCLVRLPYLLPDISIEKNYHYLTVH